MRNDCQCARTVVPTLRLHTRRMQQTAVKADASLSQTSARGVKNSKGHTLHESEGPAEIG